MKTKLNKLYKQRQITSKGLLNAVSRGWISIADVVNIVGDANSLEIIRTAKLNEISEACNKTIINGIDLELSGEQVHFNLSIEDQSNINNLFRVVELGCTEYPYQSDGGICRIYTAAEISQIYLASQSWITTQTTYHNTLKAYILSLDNVSAISEVVYGMDLPEEYATEMAAKLQVAQDQVQNIINKLEVM